VGYGAGEVATPWQQHLVARLDNASLLETLHQKSSCRWDVHSRSEIGLINGRPAGDGRVAVIFGNRLVNLAPVVPSARLSTNPTAAE